MFYTTTGKTFNHAPASLVEVDRRRALVAGSSEESILANPMQSLNMQDKKTRICRILTQLAGQCDNDRVHNCSCSNCSISVYYLDIPSFTFCILKSCHTRAVILRNVYHSLVLPLILDRLGFWANRHRTTQNRTTTACINGMHTFESYASDLFESKKDPGQFPAFPGHRDRPRCSRTIPENPGQLATMGIV